jgi:predicted amidohydrolase YtcJ
VVCRRRAFSTGSSATGRSSSSAYDGHSGWANSKALELAGIDRNTKFDGFGEIVRNEAGEPTGALKEERSGWSRRSFRSRPVTEAGGAPRRSRARRLTRHHQHPEREWLARGALALRRTLPTLGRVDGRAFRWPSRSAKRRSDEAVSSFAAAESSTRAIRRLRASSVKFVLDGVIESHTAAMIERYSDLPAEFDRSHSASLRRRLRVSVRWLPGSTGLASRF